MVPRSAAALALALSLVPLPALSQATPVPAAAAVEAAPAHAAAVRPFFEERLPEPLLRRGPRGLLWWQWLAVPVLVALALAAGAALGYATRRVLGHLAARTQTRWDDLLLEKLARPLTAFWAVAVFTAFHPWLGLGAGASAALHHVLRAATYLVLFWAGFRTVDVAFAAASTGPWTRGSPGLLAFLPLGRKVGKVVLLALGFVAVLDALGFEVASLLAGLGIGGIALALAAQKTVENLFGSVAIGVDQPFRIGDFVRIEDFVGTVEAIGMRSTRIRTLDRTLVSIPNGKLADMRTETFAVRDRIRLLANLGLAYGTTAEQMRAVLAGVEAALRGHPRLWPEGASVRFTDLRDSTLNVEVVAWFDTPDWSEFTGIRQELLLEFMAIVERAGTSFAFPTRTVHVVQAPPT
ncbi:MAG TPA: mechanosensitive ion channel family protein [Anaeromyxobacter sp.]|nr:mechanosensitive ion channel family protein [Anaeromyxobacter sp.]